MYNIIMWTRKRLGWILKMNTLCVLSLTGLTPDIHKYTSTYVGAYVVYVRMYVGAYVVYVRT